MDDPDLVAAHTGPSLPFVRRPGDETQLTAAIVRLCRRDPVLARGLAHAVLAAADSGSPRGRDADTDVPETVTVSNEVRLGPRRDRRWRPSGGRVDWLLAGTNFAVVVEVKVGAKVAAGQLERYLAFDGFRNPANAGGLVLLTRNRVEVPRRVWRNPRWRGQVTWDVLVPALKGLTATDPEVNEEWQDLLTQVEQPGDLAAAPIAWQRRGLTAGQRNARILQTVLDSTCLTLERALAERHRLARPDGLCGYRRRNGGRSVGTTRDRAQAGLFLPAGAASPAVTVALHGSRQPLKLTTSVRVVHRIQDRPQIRQARLDAMVAAGFIVDGARYTTTDRIAPTPGVEPPESPALVVRAVLEKRLAVMVSCGALDGRLGWRSWTRR